MGRVLNVTEQFSPGGNITTLSEYNVADDLVKTTAPDGAVTTVAYDRAGRKLSINDPDSRGDWEHEYDNNESPTCM